MYHIALKMLLGDRAKYVMLVGGLTFAALLMTQQCAVFIGLLSWTTSHMRNMRASIWVVDPKVEQINEIKPLRDTDVNRVRSVAAEHAQLRAEVKRLKNLKRKEIEDKARLNQIAPFFSFLSPSAAHPAPR